MSSQQWLRSVGPMRDLATLPKAHLHLHLEAGMSPQLLAELAAKYEREVPVILICHPLSLVPVLAWAS